MPTEKAEQQKAAGNWTSAYRLFFRSKKLLDKYVGTKDDLTLHCLRNMINIAAADPSFFVGKESATQ